MENLDAALVVLVIGVLFLLVFLSLGLGGGGSTWKVHQLRVTAPNNQIILGCNTGIINNQTVGTVTYNLPDPAVPKCEFILSEATDIQTINSSLLLSGNLVLNNNQDRNIQLGNVTSQTGTHNLTILGSNSQGSATGGSITLQAGSSALGNGGDINLIPGKNGHVNFGGGGSGPVFGDNILFSTDKDHSIKFVTSGDTSHDLTIHGLDTTGAATGGNVTVSAGDGLDTGHGGIASLLGGQGGATSGGGGNVNIAGGDGVGNGHGGVVNINGGNSTGAANNGGSVLITTGTAASGDGGFLQLLGGDSTSNGKGGQINITAGQGTTAGGSLNLVSGIGSGVGIKSGDLTLDVGSSAPSSAFGDIKIGTARSANLFFGSGTAVATFNSTSPTSILTMGGAEIDGTLLVKANATVQGTMQTAPAANLLVAGNAKPTVSILATGLSHLRFAADDVNSANFIQSGDAGGLGAKRELKFTGIEGTPLWVSFNANGNGNIVGKDTTDATSATDTNAALSIAGGAAIAKTLYVGSGLFLPTTGLGTAASLNYYETTTFTATYTFTGGATVVNVPVLVTRIGNLVHLVGNTAITSAAAGNTGAITSSPNNLPLRFQPPVSHIAMIKVRDNNAVNNSPGQLEVTALGALVITKDLDATTAFAGGAATGADAGWSTMYITNN